MAVRIADIPATDRPRERLRRIGIAGLSDAELIALVIRSGSRGRNVIDVATSLLADSGSLAGLSSSRLEDFARFDSVGEAKAASLAAAFELGRRAGLDEIVASRIEGPQDIVRSVIPYIAEPRREEVFVLAMNGANRLTSVDRLSLGTADEALFSVREAVSVVLRREGVCFGVAHTHPSGDTSPSAADVLATKQLRDAARATGLRLLDHVILSGKRWTSLRELGHLDGPDLVGGPLEGGGYGEEERSEEEPERRAEASS